MEPVTAAALGIGLVSGFALSWATYMTMTRPLRRICDLLEQIKLYAGDTHQAVKRVQKEQLRLNDVGLGRLTTILQELEDDRVEARDFKKLITGKIETILRNTFRKPEIAADNKISVKFDIDTKEASAVVETFRQATEKASRAVERLKSDLSITDAPQEQILRGAQIVQISAGSYFPADLIITADYVEGSIKTAWGGEDAKKVGI